MSPHVEPVAVKSIDDLADVVSVAECMGYFRVKTYGALLGRIKSKRIPAPFTARPMQFRKSDIKAKVSELSNRGRRGAGTRTSGRAAS